jgi:hypothetical protein
MTGIDTEQPNVGLKYGDGFGEQQKWQPRRPKRSCARGSKRGPTSSLSFSRSGHNLV